MKTIYPCYVEGTSAFGYFNQMTFANAFPARFLFATKNCRYKQRKNPIYLSPLLAETHSIDVAKNIYSIMPPDVLDKIAEDIRDEIFPFSANSANTYELLVEKELKYCPECIKKGEHYTYQQLIIHNKCREHGIPLRKGCPHCGAIISSSIEITHKEAFFCDKCNNSIMSIKEPAELLVSLKNRASTESHSRRTTSQIAETDGFVFGLPNNKRLSDDALIKVKNYFKSGEISTPTIYIEKNGLAHKECKLKDFIIPYAKGRLKKYDKKDKLVEFIVNNETVENTPEDRSAAFLFRLVVDDINPRRLSIKPLKLVFSALKRALSYAGLTGDDVDSVATAILNRYISDLYTMMVKLINENPDKTLLYLTHENLIQDISYDIIVLEDKDAFKVYMIND